MSINRFLVALWANVASVLNFYDGDEILSLCQ